jgi:hypothetical protein
MKVRQSGYKVRCEHGNLAKTLQYQFGRSCDNNLARNTFSYSSAREGVEKQNVRRSLTVTPKLVGGCNPQRGG